MTSSSDSTPRGLRKCEASNAFLTPVPDEPSFAALNAALERQCVARLNSLGTRPDTDRRAAHG
jgi:hypothetical protein